jgi:predicted enzyme related to lactoylglutathione lyase
MRNATLAMTVALALVDGQLQAAPPKSPPADVGPGRIAWFDITTTNLPQSKEFYGRLFDWNFAPVQGSDQAVEIVARGEAIGTLRVADGKISPFNGVIYVQVTDIQASCKKSKELGGTVAPGFPFNLPDGIGAIALVLDPTGHPVGMYSRTPLPSAASTQVTIPARSGDQSRGHAPQPAGATARDPGRHLTNSRASAAVTGGGCAARVSRLRKP